MTWSWPKAIAALALVLLLAFVAQIIRWQTDGKIDVTFVVGSAGVGGKIYIDDQFLGVAKGPRSSDGSISRDWRIKYGRHMAQLVTPRGDTLREVFVADESALVELAHDAGRASADSSRR